MTRMTHKDGEKGSILMEMLMMVGILVIVFPIIQKGIKERSDKTKNELIVRDMMKIKAAVENYLDKAALDMTEEFRDICDGCAKDFSELEPWGLPPNFRNVNIIGQKYRVRIKRVADTDEELLGKASYDAIIVAEETPEDIPDMRIRDIVSESKGFGGYYEGGNIYGANWVLSADAWKYTAPLNPWDINSDPKAIIFKTGSQRKDYEYITRRPGSNKMNNTLFMNFNNITGINMLTFKSAGNPTNKVEVSNLNVNPVSTIGQMSVENKLTLASDMSAANVVLPNGLSLPAMILSTTETDKILLENTISGHNLSTSNDAGANPYDVFGTANAGYLNFASPMPLNLYVANDLTTPQDDLDPVLATAMEINMVDIESPDSGKVEFGNIEAEADSRYSLRSSAADSKFNGYDVVVKNLTRHYSAGGTAMGGRKVGGIDITENMPLSAILRALSYEYADIYRLSHNGQYPQNSARPVMGVSYEERHRCLFDAPACTGGQDSDASSSWDLGSYGY